jgi:general secretion pathway protein H
LVRPRAESGFTLIELVVVLALAALLLAFVAPRMMGSHGSASLEGAARQMAAALRDTRSEAIRRNRSQAFAIDAEAPSYRSAVSSRPVMLPQATSLVLYTTTDEQVDEASGAIRFFPDGSSTGGGIRLRRGGAAVEIRVDWLTGRVSLREVRDVATR